MKSFFSCSMYRFTTVMVLAFTLTISGYKSFASTTQDEALSELAKDCLAPLKSSGASKVAMTYLFHNGSGESAISNYVKRLLTIHLLRAAGSNLGLIDRQDFKIQSQEDGFGFIFSTGDDDLAQPESVNAILIGELITSSTASTMVVFIKAVDPSTSKIISASLVNLELSNDLAARLGISELDLPNLLPLPTPEEDFALWTRDLSAAFDPKQISCSLDDPGISDAASALNTRLLRAYLTLELVSGDWNLLEREMFFLVARDQTATGEELSGYPTGEVILRIQIDDTAPKDKPMCFVRTIQRNDGRLLGQTQITLSASVAGGAVGQGIGGDQALADALRRTQDQLAPNKEDSLVFSASIILTDELNPSRELAEFMASNEPNNDLFHLGPNNIGSFSRRDLLNVIARGEKNKLEINKRIIIEESLLRLNKTENGNFDAIKADILCFLLWGYFFDFESEGGNTKTFVHLGPMIDIAMQICQNYSLSSDGSPTPKIWLNHFGPGAATMENHSSGWLPSRQFMGLLWQSMHPLSVFSEGKDRLRGARQLEFPRGTHNIVQSHDKPTIHFDYEIELVWKEAFPSTIKITIDLTPMKNSIYKIRK